MLKYICSLICEECPVKEDPFYPFSDEVWHDTCQIERYKPNDHKKEENGKIITVFDSTCIYAKSKSRNRRWL